MPALIGRALAFAWKGIQAAGRAAAGYAKRKAPSLLSSGVQKSAKLFENALNSIAGQAPEQQEEEEGGQEKQADLGKLALSLFNALPLNVKVAVVAAVVIICLLLLFPLYIESLKTAPIPSSLQRAI